MHNPEAKIALAWCAGYAIATPQGPAGILTRDTVPTQVGGIMMIMPPPHHHHNDDQLVTTMCCCGESVTAIGVPSHSARQPLVHQATHIGALF